MNLKINHPVTKHAPVPRGVFCAQDQSSPCTAGISCVGRIVGAGLARMAADCCGWAGRGVGSIAIGLAAARVPRGGAAFGNGTLRLAP
jgi:hypothetical protein